MTQSNNPPVRKSSRDLSEFAQAAAAAAAIDGVNLPSFTPATARNVAAAKSTPIAAPAVLTEPAPLAEAFSAGAETAHLAPGDELVTHIDLGLIDPNPQNSRLGYMEFEIQDMMRDLRSAGRQLQPIILEPNPNSLGRFYCLDGYTRVQALRRMGESKGEAIVRQVGDPWVRYKISYYANNANRHTFDYDDGMRWKELINEGVVTQMRIANELGERFSMSNISRIMSVAKFPDAINAYVGEHKNKLSASFYYPAYQLYADSLQEGKSAEELERHLMKVFTEVVEQDLSVRDSEARLKDVRKALFEPSSAPTDGQAPSAPQKQLVEHPMRIAGVKAGVFKDWGDGRLELKIKKVAPEVREKLRKAIEEVLADATAAP